jgi:excisionase family DNA binding protein
LKRREVERVGRDMAGARGLTFLPVQAGEYVSGKLVGSINLASGRFAVIDNGIESSLVPWQDVLGRRIGQHIAVIARPYVVGLIEKGTLPARMVGNHRRLPLQDVLAYRADSRAKQRHALRELAAYDQELGLK